MVSALRLHQHCRTLLIDASLVPTCGSQLYLPVQFSDPRRLIPQWLLQR
ncbi:MAG: hypothetical protein ACK56F_33095 [bacterium]